MYYGARYYAAEIGRFVQPDSMLPDIYDPQQLNRYAYVRNNPLKYVDPSGLEPDENYSSLDEAGGQALLDAQSPTLKTGWEYGGMICKPWFRNCYYYTPPHTDKNKSEVLFGACGLFSTDAATYHSHGESRNPSFSLHDKQEAAEGKIPWFLIGRDNKRRKLLPDGTIIILNGTQ